MTTTLTSTPASNPSGAAAPSTNQPSARSGRGPAVVTPGRNSRVKSRVRAQWLVLAAALTVLAGLLVAWALAGAADRVDVVSMARPVAAGTVIQLDDLTVAHVAFDGEVQGLVPATSMDALVGRMATVDLPAGSLLTAGMWADATGLTAGERTVGAVLDAGRFPIGLAQGSAALAVAIDGEPAGVAVRVVDATTTEAGELRITLAVPDADASRIAQLAATDRLVVIGMPATTAATALGSNGEAASPTGTP
jgi:flagella basal body P-ring formation protein FlgA